MKRRNIAKLVFSCLLVLMMVFSLSACSSSSQTSQSATAKKVKIGFIDHQTGALNQTGTWVMNGEKLAVDEINANGGITVGNEKMLIAPYYYDSASTADGAVASLQKFMNQEQGKIVLGTMATDATAAMMPIAEQNKILVLSTAAAGPVLSSNGWKFYVRGGAYNTAYYAAVTDLVANKIKAKNVYLLVVNNAWGVSYGDAYSKMLKDAGVNVLAYDKFNNGQGDYSALVTKISAAKPDLLLEAAETEDNEPLMKQLRLSMPNLKVVETGGSIIETMLKTIPNLSPYIGASKVGPDTPEMDAVSAKYKEKYKEGANAFVFNGYDDMYLMAAALEKAGQVTDTEKIRQAFNQLDFTKLSGKYTPFKDNGDNALSPAFSVITKDNKVQTFWPDDPKLMDAINTMLGK